MKLSAVKIRNSPTPVVSVVIPVVNERRTMARVIQQAARVHQQTEVIVVSNGSTDGTMQLAQRMGARVIIYESPLGHDVGRTIGAREAKGDIILFTDGDIVIPARDLKPLVQAIAQGGDVALNNYSGPTNKRHVHSVVLAKHALNIAMSRADLRGASMTAIPHAISRKALNEIGAEHLTVPPMALAIAIHKGLLVRTVNYIDVGWRNPRKRVRTRTDPLEQLIVGDHLEAIHCFVGMSNERGCFPDLSRARDMVT
ncbi:MAG TPA: glycosyltransferase family A protein [Bacilli bacterium]